MSDAAALVQVGWMLSPDLAAEFDVTPLSDDYLITLEQAEQDDVINDLQDLVDCPGCGDQPDIPLSCTVCGRKP